MIVRKILLFSIIIILLVSCVSVKKLPFDSAEDRANSALIILGNPPGTYPVTNADIPELLGFTRDENPAVRHMAIFQLQQLNNTSFYEDLLPLLLDNDISVSRNTEELLLKDREDALVVLRKALNNEDSELRYKALDLLVKLEDRESLPLIIELFDEEQEELVEKAILSASKLADVNDKVLYETLLRPEPALRIGVIKTFNKLRDPTVLGTLLPYFYDPDIKVQNAVKFAFIDFGDESVPYLLNVLNNPAPQTQLAVLGLLEALQNKESILPIINLFGNENERVRARAVNTISTFKENAVDDLGESLESDDKDILLNSILLLGKIRTDEALDYLIPYLDHKDKEIREAVFDAILLFTESAGRKLLSIIDRRHKNLYSSAVKGLILLRDIRLIIDNQTSLFNRNNRSEVLIFNSSLDDLTSYLNDLSLSGLIVRDFTLIKEISLASLLLISSQRTIAESGSRYTTFYISKNDFLKKSDEALKLSFSYMRDYMSSKNPEDLEEAKKQQEFSNLYKESALNLNDELENYIGTTEEEKKMIDTFETSRQNIIDFYESVSLNRKILADEILAAFNLNYSDIVSGEIY